LYLGRLHDLHVARSEAERVNRQRIREEMHWLGVELPSLSAV
jgi:hypothetical protein